MRTRNLLAALCLSAVGALASACWLEVHDGFCGGDHCGPLECCLWSCGGTDRYDACADTALACDMIWDPVCGCDGRTYGNACVAHTSCMAIAHRGACAPDVIVPVR